MQIFKNRFASAVMVCLVAIALLGAGDDQRFDKLGHHLMCSCGCGQVLLECNHVGCTRSDGQREELKAGLAAGNSDDQILQSFVEKYGTTILAAPTTTGFNRVAWIMPFFALLSGLLLAIMLIRRWGSQMKPAAQSAPSETLDPFREQARRETEL